MNWGGKTSGMPPTLVETMWRLNSEYFCLYRCLKEGKKPARGSFHNSHAKSFGQGSVEKYLALNQCIANLNKISNKFIVSTGR